MDGFGRCDRRLIIRPLAKIRYPICVHLCSLRQAASRLHLWFHFLNLDLCKRSIVYHDVLAQVEPDQVLYLAISAEVASGLFEEPIGELLLRNNRVRLLVFEPDAEAIVKWIP